MNPLVNPITLTTVTNLSRHSANTNKSETLPASSKQHNLFTQPTTMIIKLDPYIKSAANLFRSSTPNVG